MWTASLATPQPVSKARVRAEGVRESRQPAAAEPRARPSRSRSKGRQVVGEIAFNALKPSWMKPSAGWCVLGGGGAGVIEAEGDHLICFIVEQDAGGVDEGGEAGGAGGGDGPGGTAEVGVGGEFCGGGAEGGEGGGGIRLGQVVGSAEPADFGVDITFGGGEEQTGMVALGCGKGGGQCNCGTDRGGVEAGVVGEFFDAVGVSGEPGLPKRLDSIQVGSGIPCGSNSPACTGRSRWACNGNRVYTDGGHWNGCPFCIDCSFWGV